MSSSTAKKKLRVMNKDKAAKRDLKKIHATDGKSKAHNRKNEIQNRRAEKAAKAEDLKKRMAAAKQEEKQSMQMELDGLEKEIAQDDTEMTNAEQEEANFTRQEEEAEKENVHDEIDDPNDPDNPMPTTEGSTALFKALLTGKPLKDSPDPLDIIQRVGLRNTEAVVGYKYSGYGKVGIVCDAEIKDWPIYRIRKRVIIGEEVPDIVESRRAGKKKGDSKTRWCIDDLHDVRGIAIAVPPGYSGKVEDLVVPIPKLSAAEKESLRLQRKPVPRQPDVQLLIEWKEKDEKGRVLTWENRQGCRGVWKSNADLALLNAARHFEGHYRDAGGKHQSEEREVSPFPIPSVGSSLSPEGTPDPEQAASTRSTPGRDTTPLGGSTPPSGSGNKSKGDSTAMNKAAERAEFKNDWCEDRGITPDKITDQQTGKMMAAFKVYWDDLKKAASED